MKGQDAVCIGLNAHLLSRHAGYRQAGIHNYIQQLIRHLPAVDPSLRYSVFAGCTLESNDGVARDLDWQISRWPTQNPWGRITWEQFIQPWALRRENVDLMHALAFVAPIFSRTPTVVTVHDLSFLRFPGRFRPANRWYLSTMTRLSCRRAQRVIAVSQATADETRRLLGVPAESIDVIPHGVEHDRFRPLPDDQVEAFRKNKGLPEQFVLFVGTLEPRKNLVTLIKAFGQTRAVQKGVALVVVGGKGWYYQEVFRQVEALDLTDVVYFAGFVPDVELPLWYNAATVFVYPSIYEGFGMPLLEAMACGTPVIGSSASCLPEVVADAGALVAPRDTTGLARLLDRLLRDVDLRTELSRKGLDRAADFTWGATAAATVASYRQSLELDQ
jgi:glycosyltransferase involved in cell wall biosynthesis